MLLILSHLNTKQMDTNDYSEILLSVDGLASGNVAFVSTGRWFESMDSSIFEGRSSVDSSLSRLFTSVEIAVGTSSFYTKTKYVFQLKKFNCLLDSLQHQDSFLERNRKHDQDSSVFLRENTYVILMKIHQHQFLDK